MTVAAAIETDQGMDGLPSFSEHYVPREQGRVYARDYGDAVRPSCSCTDFPIICTSTMS